MKFVAVLVATAACVTAGTFVSPINGSTISSSGTFNFTWISSRYSKESSQSISVLLGGNLEGVILTKDLTSIANGVGEAGPTYYADLTPEFVASSSHTGEYQLIVIEDYTAYGGNPAMSVEYEFITLS